MLKNLFGDKVWITSLTAWGVFIIMAGEGYCLAGSGVAADGVTAVDILPFASTVCGLTLKAGVALTALGIRRKLNS